MKLLTEQVMYKGTEVTVKYFKEDYYINQINSIYDELIDEAIENEDENLIFTRLYECDEYETPTGTLEDVNKERQEFIDLIHELLFLDFALINNFDNILTKKNGKFKKKSISVIKTVESATNYFCEYTNSWRTYQLRLRALSEDEVELVLESIVINA